LATAQDKVDPNGAGVASATTAANANKLYQVTSQRDLVSLYGTPNFYTTTNGTPIQGYELNEYGLLAAYSLLGVTNRCYVLRADIDLASLVGQTGRPTGNPANGTLWLDTASSTWGIYEFNATTGSFLLQNPIVITDDVNMSGDVPSITVGNIGDYAVYAPSLISNAPGTVYQYFYKTTANQWVGLGSPEWKQDWPTIQGTESNPVLNSGDFFNLSLDGDLTVAITVPVAETVASVAAEINNLGYGYLSASVRNGKLCIFENYPEGVSGPARYITISTGVGSGTVLDDLGIATGTYYQPITQWGTSAQQPLWQTGQSTPRPSGSVWLKVGGTGLAPVIQEFSNVTESWITKEVTLSTSDNAVNATLDPTGGQAIPAGTIYAQYNFNLNNALVPVEILQRVATGPTVITGTNNNPNFSVLAPLDTGPYSFVVQVSQPGQASLSSPYTVTINEGADAADFVVAWASAGIPYTTAAVTTSGAIQITHTEGG
jgi:hypothetical protein